MKCPECGGEGKYIGLNTIEDPCENCGGGEVVGFQAYETLGVGRVLRDEHTEAEDYELDDPSDLTMEVDLAFTEMYEQMDRAVGEALTVPKEILNK